MCLSNIHYKLSHVSTGTISAFRNCMYKRKMFRLEGNYRADRGNTHYCKVALHKWSAKEQEVSWIKYWNNGRSECLRFYDFMTPFNLLRLPEPKLLHWNANILLLCHISIKDKTNYNPNCVEVEHVLCGIHRGQQVYSGGDRNANMEIITGKLKPSTGWSAAMHGVPA